MKDEIRERARARARKNWLFTDGYGDGFSYHRVTGCTELTQRKLFGLIELKPAISTFRTHSQGQDADEDKNQLLECVVYTEIL